MKDIKLKEDQNFTIDEHKQANKAMFGTMMHYYLKYWQQSIILLIFTLIIVLASLSIPLLTLQMTMAIQNNVNNGVDFSNHAIEFWGLTWQQLTYISLGVIVIYYIVCYLYDYIAYLIGRKIEIDLRNRSLETLVKQDISYYSDKKIGEILTKIVSDTQIVGDQAIQIPLQLLLSVFELIGGLIMMFIISPMLALIPTVLFAAIMVTMLLFFVITKRRVEKTRETITDINGNVTDRIATIRLIKSTGTELYETKRFKEVHKMYYKKAELVGRMSAFMLTTMWGGIFLLQFSSIIGSVLLFNDDADFFANTFASFTMAQSMMIGPLFNIMNSLFGLSNATVAAKRVNDQINAKSIMNSHYYDGIKVEKLDGDIEFKNIEFRYPEKPNKLVLPKFDFTFKEGKSYAFVGETGSGKSTIAKLLLRFYDPSEGKIIINNNINLKEVNLQSYLNHVGYVEQEPQILFGDIYENVKYGKFDATDDEVIEACKKAELHDLVMTWQDGYDTILGERGFLLSGGQKQRLVIARIFLKNPKVLILDEATSALDNIVEKEIQEKLDILMKGRTAISIAHRLSTIKNCDEIIVLGANGQGIVQRGTFNELKNKEGHFKKLYNAGLIE